MNDTVAETEIECLSPSGESFTSVFRVGRPRIDERGMWACSLSMDGFFREDRPIFGADSLQALCLALAFAHSQLKGFVARGGQLFDPKTRDEFQLSAYFIKV